MRSKQKRFEENAHLDTIIEPGKALFKEVKGQWHTVFGNTNPLHLELACGKGEYTTGLAPHHPNVNFIGVDVKGDRIWYGANVARKQGLNNVAFLRTPIQYLEEFFQEAEIEEIWIVFPDPQPKDRNEKHRLTFKTYLDLYKRILKPDGWIKLKTDNTLLYEYTLETLQLRDDIEEIIHTPDLYHSDFMPEHYGIVTRFEKKFFEKGERIKYLKFRFKTS